MKRLDVLAGSSHDSELSALLLKMKKQDFLSSKDKIPAGLKGILSVEASSEDRPKR